MVFFYIFFMQLLTHFILLILEPCDSEKEIPKFRSLLEKSANLESELRATEPLKTDILQARSDCQKLHQHSQELGVQVRTLTAELQRARQDVQLIPNLRNEIDTLRAELQRARHFHMQHVFFSNPSFEICLLEKTMWIYINHIHVGRKILMFIFILNVFSQL
jgi:DNA repair exonuclease SbcCD ATPase subunit